MTQRPLFLIGLSAFACLFILSSADSLHFAWLVLILSLPTSALAIFFLRRTDKKILFSGIAAVAISCLAFSLLFITVSKTEYSKAISAQSSQESELKGKIISTAQKSDERYYYTIRATELNNEPFDAKFRYLSREKLHYEPHTNLVIQTKAIYPLGGTDSIWHTAKKADGIYIGAYGEIQSAEPPVTKNIHYYILKLQEYISSKTLGNLPGKEGAVLLGFLLGKTDNIDHTTYANSKIIGITHLFSVSGLHVSLWSLLIAYLFKKTRLPTIIQNLLCICILFFIVAVTGFSPSAVRAGIMMGAFFLGNMIFKDADSLNSLGLALLVILIANPFSARSISLILSFSAALGILLFAGKIEGFFSAKLEKLRISPLRKLLLLLLPSIYISLSVIISSLPWMIYFFGSVSVIAPLANLFVILPSSAAMVLTGAAILFSSINFIFYPLITLAGLIAKYIIFITNLLSKLKGALINIEPFLLVFSIGAAIFIGIYLYKLGRKKRIFQVSYLMFIVFLLSSNLLYTLIPTKSIEINIPDVANNSAIILSQNNNHALIGCGGWGSAASFALSSKNIHKLDFLIIPRTQDTESAGADKILESYSPKRVIASKDCLGKPWASNECIEFSNSRQCSLLENINFDYYNSSDFSAMLLDCNQKSVLICFLPASDFSKMPLKWQQANILICRSAVPESLDPSRFEQIIISTDAALPPDNLQTAITSAGSGNINIKISRSGAIKIS